MSPVCLFMSVWGVRFFGGGVGGGSVDEDGQDGTEGGVGAVTESLSA